MNRFFQILIAGAALMVSSCGGVAPENKELTKTDSVLPPVETKDPNSELQTGI